MATYENNDYASKGVGTAGLTLGVIGTALASGVLNGNGLGGLFGNQNPATSPIYQLSQKDNEIALLKAQQYSDNKLAVLTERVSNLEARVLADEKTDPLRDQILGDRIAGLQNIDSAKAALDLAFANVPKVSYFGFSFTSDDVPALLAKMQGVEEVA